MSPLRDTVIAQQKTWKFLGNRFVETHIHGKAQAEKKQLVEVCFFCSRSAVI
jgi:hypothetical protein